MKLPLCAGMLLVGGLLTSCDFIQTNAQTATSPAIDMHKLELQVPVHATYSWDNESLPITIEKIYGDIVVSPASTKGTGYVIGSDKEKFVTLNVDNSTLSRKMYLELEEYLLDSNYPYFQSAGLRGYQIDPGDIVLHLENIVFYPLEIRLDK